MRSFVLISPPRIYSGVFFIFATASRSELILLTHACACSSVRTECTFTKENEMNEDSGNSKKLAVSPESFDEISTKGAAFIIELTEKYALSIKSKGSLLRDITQKIEEHFLPVTQSYVKERLDEQVNLYIANGFHEYAGCTANSFRILLTPLIDATIRSFAPPAKHLVLRGEFTILLVLPTRHVPLRRQFMTLMGESFQMNIPDFELHKHGKASPRDPYVLVGIDGGRMLRNSPIVKADKYVEDHGYTYFAVHELIQLLLVRPEFLRSQSDVLSGSLEPVQTAVLALGEKCTVGLVRLSAENKPSSGKREFTLDYLSPANTLAGAGFGKPYYKRMVTCEVKNTPE